MTLLPPQDSLPERVAYYTRLSFLTKAYGSLQGLRLMPVWLMGALQPLIGFLPNRRPTFVQDFVMLGGFVFCILWFWFSGKWYQKHYGSVETRSTLQKLFWIPAFPILLGVYFFAWSLDEGNPPVSFMALYFVCFLLVFALMLPSDRIRLSYYGSAAAFMLLVSLVPMTGWISAYHLMISSPRQHPYQAWGFFTFHILMFIGTILDHFLLVRRISRVRGHLYV